MDEIISEVRKIRGQIVKEHKHDLHALCEYLKKKEGAHKDRLVNLKKRKELK